MSALLKTEIAAENDDNARHVMLHYGLTPRLDFVEVIEDLERLLRNIALEFDVIRTELDTSVAFIGPRLEVLIEATDTPAARRESRLAAMTRSLRIEVRDGAAVTAGSPDADGRPIADEVKLAACYQLARDLSRRARPDLVEWAHTGVISTAEEFETTSGQVPAVRPRRPATDAARRLSRRSSRPTSVLAGAATAAPFAIADTHRRLDASFVRRVRPAAGGPRRSHRPTLRGQDRPAAARALPLPEQVAPGLTPAPTEAQRRMAAELAAEQCAAELARDAFRYNQADMERAARGPVHRLAVYALNTLLMILAFPVGLAVLLLNVLSGEDMRTTAHAMSVTALFLSLGMVGLLDNTALAALM